MRKLVYHLLHVDFFRRLLKDMRERPGKWLSRLVFLLGPWISLWMVEIMNENNVFQDLDGWQILGNMVWYYSLFAACRLILGRNRRAAALGSSLSFAAGLLNHYVLRFRGRILFPADVLAWRTAANVAQGFDYSLDKYILQAAALLIAYLFLVWLCVPQRKRAGCPGLSPDFSGLSWAATASLSSAPICCPIWASTPSNGSPSATASSSTSPSPCGTARWRSRTTTPRRPSWTSWRNTRGPKGTSPCGPTRSSW